MALKITKNFTNAMIVSENLSFNINNKISKEFYCKVEQVTSNKENAQFTLTYKIDDFIAGNKQFFFVPNLDGDNFIKQCYDYLKTLPDFTDAVDC